MGVGPGAEMRPPSRRTLDAIRSWCIISSTHSMDAMPVLARDWMAGSRPVRVEQDGNQLRAVYREPVPCGHPGSQPQHGLEEIFRGTLQGNRLEGTANACKRADERRHWDVISAPSRGLVSQDGKQIMVCWRNDCQTWSLNLRAVHAPIEVKLRLFIPSQAAYTPAPGEGIGLVAFFPVSGWEEAAFVTGPLLHGDDRSFDYATGTHRAQLSGTVVLGKPRGSPWMSRPKAEFGESRQYRVMQGAWVPGKPWWWWALNNGNGDNPRHVETLAVTASRLGMEAERMDESTVDIQMHGDAGVPMTKEFRYLAPRINFDLRLILQEREGEPARWQLVGAHDGFPAYELYLNGTMVWSYDPSISGGSPLSLVGKGERKVVPRWAQVPNWPARLMDPGNPSDPCRELPPDPPRSTGRNRYVTP
jgi:hypothetical protein